MEGEEEKDESRHFGQQGFDKNKMCVFVPTGVHEINVLFLQMINNWKFHHHTGKCLTTHYLSLNAQEAYYMGVRLPHTGHHIIQVGCVTPQEQHTLGSHVNQTTENQTGSSDR